MKLNLSRLISNLSFSKTSVVNVSGTNELTRAQSTLMTKKKKNQQIRVNLGVLYLSWRWSWRSLKGTLKQESWRKLFVSWNKSFLTVFTYLLSVRSLKLCKRQNIKDRCFRPLSPKNVLMNTTTFSQKKPQVLKITYLPSKTANSSCDLFWSQKIT